jgi:hypothetical protein
MLTAVLKAVKMLLSCCPKNSQDASVLAALKAVQDAEKNHPYKDQVQRLIPIKYFTFKKGVVRVETQGICTGHTFMDHGLKKYVVVLFPSNSHQLKYLDISRLYPHCRYPANQVPPRTVSKSRQGAGCASTRCHASCGSGSRLPTREGSDADTHPVAPNLASLLVRAPVPPRAPWLWTPSPSPEVLQCCHASHSPPQAVKQEIVGCNGRAARLARYRGALACYLGDCKTCGQTTLP